MLPKSLAQKKKPSNKPSTWDTSKVVSALEEHGLEQWVAKAKEKRLDGATLLKASRDILARYGFEFDLPTEVKYEEMMEHLKGLEKTGIKEESGPPSILPQINALFNEADMTSAVAALELTTILLSNIRKNPSEDKYRRVRKENAKVKEKITRWKTGLDMLLACGFKDDGDVLWYLDERVADRSVDKALTEIQRYIANLSASSRSASATGMSAAQQGQSSTKGIPAVLRPEQYSALSTVSTTQQMESTLEGLRAEMRAAMGPPQMLDRSLCAFPSSHLPPIISHSQGPADEDSVVAKAAADMERERKKREQFQTKSMREIEKLKKMKVYNCTILRIKFPDNNVLQGVFHPLEKVGTVLEVINQCVVEAALPFLAPELFTTPPKIVYDPSSTLQDAGLVPAASLLFRDMRGDAQRQQRGERPPSVMLLRHLFEHPVQPVMPLPVKTGLGGGVQPAKPAESSKRVTTEGGGVSDAKVKAKMNKFFKF